METIFSKIIRGDLPGYKIYEDEYVCAFLDINPIQRGHVLVVPKVEVDQFFDIEEKMFDHMMHRVRYIAQVMKAQLHCERVCVFIEGFGIPHAHVHLVPANKPEDFDKSHVYHATKEELEEVQKLLQA
jgi:histidine triad (HIT) family protein